MNYIIVKMGYQEVKPEQVTKLMPVKIEEDLPVPMDVDFSQMDFDDTSKPTEVNAAIRAMNKKIRQLTDEKDELSVTIHVRQDVIDRLEVELAEKKAESESWHQFAKDQSAAIDQLKEDKHFATMEEQRAKEQVAKIQEEIDEQDEKIGQLNIKITSLNFGIEKAQEELATQKDLTVTSNRQILILQDRLSERQRQLEEERKKIAEDRANKIPLFGNQAGSAFESPEARLRAEIEMKNREKSRSTRPLRFCWWRKFGDFVAEKELQRSFSSLGQVVAFMRLAATISSMDSRTGPKLNIPDAETAWNDRDSIAKEGDRSEISGCHMSLTIQDHSSHKTCPQGYPLSCSKLSHIYLCCWTACSCGFTPCQHELINRD